MGALLLILTSAKNAIVVDPAVVGQTKGVKQAWGSYYEGKNLEYRHECLRKALPVELEKTLQGSDNNKNFRVLVVACHACQHLSDETLKIACSYGVHVAVMPCCQKDLFGGSLKAFSKQVNIGIGLLIDVLTAGKVMAWTTGASANVEYEVKLRTIDRQITPQNRLILCKAKSKSQNDECKDKAINLAHQKLERAYLKAHSNSSHGEESDAVVNRWIVPTLGFKTNLSRWMRMSGNIFRTNICTKSMALGVVIGLMGSLTVTHKIRVIQHLLLLKKNSRL